MLNKARAYEFQCRGKIKVKGKGEMTTYFLTGRRAASTMRMDDLMLPMQQQQMMLQQHPMGMTQQVISNPNYQSKHFNRQNSFMKGWIFTHMRQKPTRLSYFMTPLTTRSLQPWISTRLQDSNSI